MNTDQSFDVSLASFVFHARSVVARKDQLHQEFLDLEQRMRLLDRRLADALQRIRYGSSEALIARAAQEEKWLLAELDRMMTRMRAIEGQLLQIEKAATRH